MRPVVLVQVFRFKLAASLVTFRTELFSTAVRSSEVAILASTPASDSSAATVALPLAATSSTTLTDLSQPMAVLQYSSKMAFAFEIGQTFDLFDFGSVFGSFDSISSGPLDLDFSNFSSQGTVTIAGNTSATAVPEPSSFTVLALGGIILLRRRRK